MISLPLLKKIATGRFVLPATGIHGIAHWDRVDENGQTLSKFTGADRDVVRAFAYLHDCCRESDGADPQHGPRAAVFARHLGSRGLGLTEAQVAILAAACELHEKGQTTSDPTIGTCWDADRLDLGRVGRKPNPRFLSTRKAQSKSVIAWAYQRSRGHSARLKA